MTGPLSLKIDRVRYHIYYRNGSNPAHLEILAVWHSSRGSGPGL